MKTIPIGLFLLLLFFKRVEGQIPIANPSFEDSTVYGNLFSGTISASVKIGNWHICDSSLFVANDSFWINTYPNSSIIPNYTLLGKNYLLLNISITKYMNGNVCQRFACKLSKGKSYSMAIGFSSVSISSDTPYELKAYPEVWLGKDTCSKGQLIFTHDTLPFRWQYFTFSFTATDTFQYLYLGGRYYDPVNRFGRLGIDAISPIYPLNAHAVTLSGSSNDTLVKKGACVNMHATTTINTYDSVYWLRLRGTTLDTLNRNSFSLQDCVEQASTYIVCMHDSVADCAGKWWSSDTMRVGLFPTGIAELEEGNFRFVVYPNPTKEYIKIESGGVLFKEYILTDVSGREVQEGTLQNNQINVAQLASGVYLLRLEEQKGNRVVRRIVKE